MLRVLVLCSVLSLFFLLEADGRRSSFARGLTRVQNNILKRGDPIRMLNTGSSLTSLYVGGVGIWWRSGVVAAISQMEQGKDDEAMESLRIAMTTLTVFDTTQATVSPIASELIHQLVKHKGQFRQTINGMTQYNKVVGERTLSGTVDDVDDIIDGANTWKKRIGDYFDNEVSTFMKNTQGYDDLVKGLNNAKKWAKAVTWVDTISGPFFDAANVAFCGWQLHNAIHDKDSPPEERSLNIASASMGVASGAIGVTAFVVGALATVGSTLAAVAGPIGAIIGCLLSLASIIIDLINSVNPYGTIKDHLETIQKLKAGSLHYLENEGNITEQFISDFELNTGFDTIYQINQGNIILGMRGHSYQPISGVDLDPNVVFDAKTTPGQENDNDYLTMGKNRIFDKSKYANIIFKPKGKVQLGYDFYGNVRKPDGKGVAVFATTAMVAKDFWIRGVHIDTRVENDDEEKNPDNVVIGEMTGLAYSGHNIRVWTGAGDDMLHVTGLVCNEWTYHENCLWGILGTGINTLSFQALNPDRVHFPTSSNGLAFKVFVGIKYDMRDTGIDPSRSIYLRLKDSESSREVRKYKIGYVTDVNVFHGSPFDDEIVMGDDKNCIVKNNGGRNNYIIYLHNTRDFAHTITEDSNTTLGNIFLIWKTQTPDAFTDYKFRDVVYDEETQTLVVFMRNSKAERYKEHTFTGKIIIKRTKPGDIKEMKLYLVGPEGSSAICTPVPDLHEANGGCAKSYKLGDYGINRGIGIHHGWWRFQADWNIKDRPVPGVPFHYHLDVDLEADPIPDLCGNFIISLGRYSGDQLDSGESRQFSLQLPANSFLAVDDDLIDYNLKDYSSHIEIYYLKSDKKLIYQTKYSSPPGGPFKKSSIKIHVPEAKRIVFGTPGNYQLLLDLKHDDRPAVNLNSECLGLMSRSVDGYKFTSDYTDDSNEPKQVVLGVPAKTPTRKRWRIRLGKAQTFNVEEYGPTVTGNYAENALIVDDTLWVHLSREANDVRIEFRPSSGNENGWEIAVKKGNRRIHQATVDGANTLAYHERLVRSNLYDLVNGEKKPFNLYEVWRQKMDTLEKDITDEAKMCL